MLSIQPEALADRRYNIAKRTTAGIYPKKFFDNPDLGVRIYRDLNEGHWISAVEAYQFQKQYILGKLPSKEMYDFLDWINKDIKVVLPNNEEVLLDEAISRIEDGLAPWGANSAYHLRKVDKIEKNAVQNALFNFSRIENKLKIIYDMVIKAIDNTTFNTNLLSIEKKNLEQMIIGLRAEINQMGKAYESGVGYQVSKDLQENLKNVYWLGNKIKGYYCEIMIMDWLKKHLVANVEIIDTTQIYHCSYDIFGKPNNAGKQSNMDIGVMLKQGIGQIQFTFDNKMYKMGINDFLDFVEKHQGRGMIQLVTEDLSDLQHFLIAGIQVKSGKNPQVFNNKKISINDIIDSESNKQALYLKRLVNLFQVSISLRATDKQYYNPLFEYNLAKYINNMIGVNNGLIGTRYGIMTMKDYIAGQMDKGRYFRANKNINISKPDEQLVIQLKNS